MKPKPYNLSVAEFIELADKTEKAVQDLADAKSKTFLIHGVVYESSIIAGIEYAMPYDCRWFDKVIKIQAWILDFIVKNPNWKRRRKIDISTMPRDIPHFVVSPHPVFSRKAA